MKQPDNYFSDDAHVSEETLALYVDALSLNKIYLLPAAVLEHVSDCEECKLEIVEVLSLVEDRACHAIDPHPYLGKKAKLTASRFSVMYRIAAVILVGIGLSVFFYLFRSMRDDRNVFISSSKVTEAVHPETEKGRAAKKEVEESRQRVFADNFSESPNLENLVSSASRSVSTFRASPKNGAIVNQQILFEWKTPEVESVTVNILSNKEKLLKSIRLKKSQFLFTGTLDPGLYYWKVENKDELLYVGKFLVK